ncbi:tripartite tricarboxylate transporter permease [Nocardioides sp. NPDC004968]|uniref:tripartite tricarboxylate transporter permease n=1 Tax=Nocardioides sp. NPDC004968 TaxID=3155894 RepID=UPI0033A9C0DB
MDLIANLSLGLSVAFTPENLFYGFMGTLLGTLIGVLPGLGPSATIAMLLPSLYALQPTSALIMLAGIYYGAQYGGSTTAILINVPGEASSVVTAVDGHAMARRGRAGPALAAAALGSFFAGCVGTVIVAAFARPLAAVAIEFGAADYFSLMVLGLVGAVVLASGSLLKAIAMVIVGLMMGQITTDVMSAIPRFSLGIPQLMDGFNFVVVAMGVFGFCEVIVNLSRPAEQRTVATKSVSGLWLSKKDFKEASGSVLRGTALGSLLGVLPGGGPVLASFASYSMEKKIAGASGTFGQGDIRGVAGPESANNAGAQTAFIPMLTLGLPPNASMALMIGMMTVMGIQPGPQVMTNNPPLFWGLIVSMWIGNLMLVILNLPLIGIWIRLLTVPYRLLFPAIIVFCSIGLYTLNNDPFDVYAGASFGVFGYLLHKLGCEPAPLLLGFILGPMMEENMRRALLLSRGDWTTFMTNPISAALLLIALAMIVMVLTPSIKTKRAAAFQEEG